MRLCFFKAVLLCTSLILCANIYGQDILTIEKPGQVTKLMKPSIFRKSEQIDSVKKLIIKGYLTWEDFRYLSNIDIKSVYIEGELNDDDKKKEHHRFARNVMSGSREVKYIDGNDRDRIQVDTLFVPTMNQLKSRVCGFFHPKFIYIQNNGILVLNSWTEDIKQIDQVDQINIGAFAGTKIKEITIPSKVRTIPAFCFQFCSDLKTVLLRDSHLIPSI